MIGQTLDKTYDVRRTLVDDRPSYLTIFQEDNAFSSSCLACREQSQNVYREGWTCFNPSCSQFCRRPTSTLSDNSGMTYSPEFLRLRKASGLDLDQEQWKLTPDPPPTSATSHFITTKEFAKGWWCSKCGKLCCRRVFIYILIVTY